MKPVSKEQQRENIAVAYSIIGGIPAEQFNLDRFCNSYDVEQPEQIKKPSKHNCGTIGCTLGWLALHPYFIAQGIGLRGGAPRDMNAYQSVDVDVIATRLFGRRAFDRFFDLFGDAPGDRILMKELGIKYDGYSTGTQEDHKKLALARLKRGYYSKFNQKVGTPNDQ